MLDLVDGSSNIFDSGRSICQDVCEEAKAASMDVPQK